jgi:predicted RNase H-like HicB family nuclease
MSSEELQEYLQFNYPVQIKPDHCTDGSFCYVAEHPDLPGCAAHGTTITEARTALVRARKAYISHMLSVGEKPPRPTTGREPDEVTWRWPVKEPDPDLQGRLPTPDPITATA